MEKSLWYLIVAKLMCFETQTIFHSYLQLALRNEQIVSVLLPRT